MRTWDIFSAFNYLFAATECNIIFIFQNSNLFIEISEEIEIM